MKIVNCKLKMGNRDGQLLIELLISLFVGGMFLLGATLGVTSILRYSFETRGNQAASGYANDVLNQVQLLANSDWHGLYDLSKGSTNHYFLNQRGSATVVIPGTESVLYNDVTAGLVGQWKFDEDIGTTTYDTSGNGNDGVMTGDPARISSPSCIAGGCLDFNGINNSYAKSDNDVSLSSDQTYSVWVYPRAVSSLVGVLTTHNYTVPSNIGINIVSSRFAPSIGYTDGTREFNSKQSNFVVPTNTWSHVVLIYSTNDNSISFYINGEFDSKWNLNKTVRFTPDKIFVGQWSYAYVGNYRLNGLVDDARVYNRALSAEEIKSLYESPVYDRYFFTENTNRDTNLNIVSTGGVVDPSTQKVTVGVTWEGGRQLQLYHYFMRNTIFVLHNNNWSGGPGNTGTTTSATSTFAASYNIATSTVGQISLATTTVSGWLESATLDTQTPQGAAINSVLWQGVQPVGTNVKFQIAMSNNADGPWGYAGYDGSGSTYFSPASSNISVDVENFHNYRYFRYKIFLNPSGGAGPIVMGSMINWSK